LSRAYALVDIAVAARDSKNIQIAPSCSLLHCPVDLDAETKLDAGLKGWMAFAKRKLAEVVTLSTATVQGKLAVASAFADSDEAAARRTIPGRIYYGEVVRRLSAVVAGDLARKSPFEVRRRKQRPSLPLPLFPTTTMTREEVWAACR
jgi:5-methyltetrahydropteroyltriglutamate--homocysteine methyltransferase